MYYHRNKLVNMGNKLCTLERTHTHKKKEAIRLNPLHVLELKTRDNLQELKEKLGIPLFDYCQLFFDVWGHLPYYFSALCASRKPLNFLIRK